MVSIIAFAAVPFFYSILLLDIFKRAGADLTNIVKSITTNKNQLLYTLLLSLIAIHIFSMWGYVFLSEFFIGDELDPAYEAGWFTYCDTLWDCIVSTLHTGIRMGGGIADGLGKVEIDNDNYANRIIFDLLFFVIIIIILLNIVFGVIIDSFAELRDERKTRKKLRDNVCFICNLDRSYIELHSPGWSHHFMTEHSPFAYLAFIIYVRKKPIEDCSGLEKYVKECYSRHEISFFPDTTWDLQDRGILMTQKEKAAEEVKKSTYRPSRRLVRRRR